MEMWGNEVFIPKSRPEISDKIADILKSLSDTEKAELFKELHYDYVRDDIDACWDAFVDCDGREWTMPEDTHDFLKSNLQEIKDAAIFDIVYAGDVDSSLSWNDNLERAILRNMNILSEDYLNTHFNNLEEIRYEIFENKPEPKPQPQEEPPELTQEELENLEF
jgi:hypothetical protein